MQRRVDTGKKVRSSLRVENTAGFEVIHNEKYD
jgi:hypothetical protein